MSDLRSKLSSEIQAAAWELLVPHYERKAVIKVDGSLNLVDVGVAMAADNSEIVGEWLKNKLLIQPDNSDHEGWSEANTQFKFIIVQPYVLIQRIAEDA